MKRVLTTLFIICATIAASAQSDVVGVGDALGVFTNGKLANAKTLLAKQGYTYKGLSTLGGKNYCWAKNVDLSKDFLPQNYGKGNSSIFMLAADGKTVFLYVYNQKAFTGLQAQVKKLGYTVQKEKDGTLLCSCDGKPTVSFMQFQMPFPFCMMITE